MTRLVHIVKKCKVFIVNDIAWVFSVQVKYYKNIAKIFTGGCNLTSLHFHLNGINVFSNHMKPASMIIFLRKVFYYYYCEYFVTEQSSATHLMFHSRSLRLYSFYLINVFSTAGTLSV